MAVRAAAGVWCHVAFNFCFGIGAGALPGAKIDETSTRSAGTSGGAGCCRGGWFRRCPLESTTCRGPKSRSSRVSNPRNGRLNTTALAIGPSMSLTDFLAQPLVVGCSLGGGGVVLAVVVRLAGMCVCVCVICTYRGRSLCGAGQDAPFGSGLLRPLRDVGPPPSAESEPLWLAGSVSRVFALPCLVRKSRRATTSAAVSSSPCGTGTGGDRGGGVLGLLRLGAGGVTGLCGDLGSPGGCRVGLWRQGFLCGWSDCVERARFRCAGAGVYTLWCPLWQQWRTPLCLRVHLGQGGRLCSGHSCSWGLRATCSSA